MVGVRYSKTLKIPNVILPHSMAVDDNNIYIFDKMNDDEGRLYKFDNECISGEMLIELDDAECFFGRDGYIYFLYSDDISLIEVYNYEGYKIREIKIRDIVYYLDIDEKGRILAVCSDEQSMVIDLYSPEGYFIRQMHSRNMPLISAAVNNDDSVYAAGIIPGTSFRVEKINYVSNVENVFPISMDDDRYIVSKVLAHRDVILAVLCGGEQDMIVGIDTVGNDKVYQIQLQDINVGAISDASVKDDILYVLSENNEIIIFNIINEDDANKSSSAKTDKRQSLKYEWGYLSLVTCMKNFTSDFTGFLFSAAFPVTIVFLILAGLYMKSTGEGIKIMENIRVLIIFVNLSSLSFVLIKNIIINYKKSLKIDNLLDLYNKLDIIEWTIAKSSIYLGAILIITIVTIAYKRIGYNYFIFVYLLLAVIFVSVLYLVSRKFTREFKNSMNYCVFELMDFNVKEHDLIRRISSDIKRIRKSGAEKFRIKVLTSDIIPDEIVKLVNKWSSLRYKITGDKGRLISKKFYLVFDLDLKNRDIRYSRLSVIRDFICYIKKSVNISSVVIETIDEKE